jgi:hypothetical protein
MRTEAEPKCRTCGGEKTLTSVGDCVDCVLWLTRFWAPTMRRRAIDNGDDKIYPSYTLRKKKTES